MGKRRRKPDRQPASHTELAQPQKLASFTPPTDDWPAPRQWIRALILLSGIILPQLILIGPSLIGRKLLLPLDILADRTTYLPRISEDAPRQVPKDGTLGDLVFQTEVHRQLVIQEVYAGRLPLWNPYNYCGHPLLAANHTQAFSPYRILDYLWPSPVVLAWGALLRSIVIGTGTYLLFRRSMNLGWFAAAVGGWCASVGGPIIIASGYPGASIISFLPWLLLAIDRCIHRPDGKAVLGLSLVTAFALLSGHPAFAGHLLLAGGLFFLWRHFERFGRRNLIRPPGISSLVATVSGILLGILLSAPQTFPTVEYMRSSQRITARGEGMVEDPGIGPAAFVQMALPYSLGSTQRGAMYIGVEGNRVGNRIESAAIGYTGLFVALVFMPLGWADPARRRWMIFWTLLALFCAVPIVGNVPLIGRIFELPPLSLLRNNRLVFVSGFAVQAMGMIGLNVVAHQRKQLSSVIARATLAIGAFAALALCVWCADKALEVPVGEKGDSAAAQDLFVLLIPDRWAPAVADDVVSWFGLMYRNGALLSAVAVTLCLVLLYSSRQTQSPRSAMAGLSILLAILAVGELTALGYGVNVQTDPALYYPKLGWMDQVAKSQSRMCGVDTLPANVALSHRLRDIRGYDGADPMPVVKLIELAQNPHQAPILSLPYAVTLFLSVNPQSPGPVANLLAVRHLVGRGTPPSGLNIVYASDDYWVANNPRALPRVTVPSRIEVVPDPAERLRRLSAATADPAGVALLEAETPGATAATGSVRIVDEHPSRVVVEADLSHGGLVRLADAWDAGWQATYNGQPVSIIRVDHALRGVIVPAGKGTIEFTYAPRSVAWGLWTALGAAVVLTVITLAWRPRNGVKPVATMVQT